MFLDTSGFYCYLDNSDFRHKTARELLNAAPLLVTHNYVLAELIALCHARNLNREIALGFVRSLSEDPAIHVVWINREQHSDATQLLLARPDKTYSLCDAASFLIMRHQNISDALTTDRHFDQEGFNRLLPP